MPAPLRLGILGAGMIARAPAGVLPGMPELAGRAEIVAIASRTTATAHEVADEFGIPQVFEDLASMLRHGEIDGVVNLTSIGAHMETSRAILTAGKHLVSEKPFASTTEDADALIAIAESTGATVVVAPARMLEPSRMRAARMVAAGSIGRVTLARARVSHPGPGGMPWSFDPRPAYAADAGPLRDLAPYAIEQLVGIVAPVRRVSALTARSRDDFAAFGAGPFEGVEVTVESDDTVALLLELENGCVALVDSSFGPVQSNAAAVDLFGTEGTLELYTRYGDDLGSRLLAHHRASDGPGEWRSMDTDEDRARQRRLGRLGRASLVECLADSVEAGVEPALSARRARHVVAVIEAAERSAAEGRLVDVSAG